MAKRKRRSASTRPQDVPTRPQVQALPAAVVSLVRMFHPFPSGVVAGVTVALAFLADASPEWATVVALGVGMLCYQFAIGLANDIIDAEDDAKAKPWKALPRGLVAPRTAGLIVMGLVGAGMLVTSGLPIGSWLIGIAGLGCGLIYDVQLKRTALSWLPFSVAIPLIPLWVFTAFDAWDGLLWWVLPLGALLGFALHLANQAPDIPKEKHIRGFAHRLGTERAANLSLGLVGLAAVMAAAVLIFEGAFTQAILVAATGMLAGTMAGRAIRLFGPDGLFGLLASSSAVLAILFLSAVR